MVNTPNENWQTVQDKDTVDYLRIVFGALPQYPAVSGGKMKHIHLKRDESEGFYYDHDFRVANYTQPGGLTIEFAEKSYMATETEVKNRQVEQAVLRIHTQAGGTSTTIRFNKETQGFEVALDEKGLGPNPQILKLTAKNIFQNFIGAMMERTVPAEPGMVA